MDTYKLLATDKIFSYENSLALQCYYDVLTEDGGEEHELVLEGLVALPWWPAG